MAGELVLLSRLYEIAKSRRGTLKTDIITFRGSITTGAAVTQPDPRKIRNNFEYYMIELRAGFTGTTLADANIDDIDQVRFNISESGTGEDMFSNDVELQALAGGTGNQSVPVRFDPYGYKLGAGADLTCTLTPRATALTIARVVTVQLVCVLVPAEMAAAVLEAPEMRWSREIRKLMGEFFDRLRRS